MKIVLLLIVCAVVAWVLMRLVSANMGRGGCVTMADFSALVAALQACRTKEAFWVVLVPDTARSDGCLANLQYSIEDGAVGIDWVLLAERNIEDKHLFEKFVTRAGGVVHERSQNKVTWLRAGGLQDPIKIGQAFLQAAYDVTPETKLELINDGFKWPVRKASSFSL